MPFSDSDLSALKEGPKRIVVGAGNSLFVIVESVGKGGGKSFLGITRFPPNRSGLLRGYQIGLYGKGPGKWTLKRAKDGVNRLDKLRMSGEDPRLLKSESKREVIKQVTNPLLIKAAEGFLERSKNKHIQPGKIFIN